MGPTRRGDSQALAGNLLRVARAKAGLTQAQLAARAGVPRSTVARIEAGTRQPSLVTLDRLLVAVDLELRLRVDAYDDHDDVLDACYATMSEQQRYDHDAHHDATVAMFDVARDPPAAGRTSR